jgi:hypothetical protein
MAQKFYMVSMIITEIYKNYQIPQNLQMHMLRVAAVGNLIIDNWHGSSIDTQSIITTLLLHDLGNLIKFDLDNPTAPLENVEDLKLLQQEMKQKYNNDEHMATTAMAHEIGVNDYVMYLLNNRGSSHLDTVLTSTDWNLKLASYPDFRIDPYGVVTAEERFEEVIKRYSGRDHVLADIEKTKEKEKKVLLLEKQIQPYITYDLPSLKNNDIQNYIEKLKTYSIK